MPRKPARPCRQRGCPEVVAGSGGYCQTHKRYRAGWARSNKQSASQRGYGASWRKLRERIMRRDGYICQPCKRDGFVHSAQEVDHIISKAAGGTDEPHNLEAICRRAHAIKTRRERRAAQGEGGANL